MQTDPADEFSAPRARWELQAFHILLVLATLAAMALLWRLPENFFFGDIRTIEDSLYVVRGWLSALPAAIALFLTLASRGPHAMLALLRRALILPPATALAAVLLPLLAQILALTLWTALFPGALGQVDFANLIPQWLVMTPMAAIMLLGAEIGWRGFFLPRLLLYVPWRSAALICGLLWAGWHMPFWIPAHIAATGSPLSALVLLAANTLEALAVSVILTRLFRATGYSIAIPSLFLGAAHAGGNLIHDLLDIRAAEPSWAVIYAIVLSLLAAPFLLPERAAKSRALPA